jgi:hypothetical protein
VVVEDDEEEEELCPRAPVFRDRTIVIVSSIKNIDEENKTEYAENHNLYEVIYYLLPLPFLLLFTRSHYSH